MGATRTGNKITNKKHMIIFSSCSIHKFSFTILLVLSALLLIMQHISSFYSVDTQQLNRQFLSEKRLLVFIYTILVYLPIPYLYTILKRNKRRYSEKLNVNFLFYPKYHSFLKLAWVSLDLNCRSGASFPEK